MDILETEFKNEFKSIHTLSIISDTPGLNFTLQGGHSLVQMESWTQQEKCARAPVCLQTEMNYNLIADREDHGSYNHLMGLWWFPPPPLASVNFFIDSFLCSAADHPSQIICFIASLFPPPRFILQSLRTSPIWIISDFHLATHWHWQGTSSVFRQLARQTPCGTSADQLWHTSGLRHTDVKV